MNFSNKLDDAQVEALAWLSEECGEVVRIIGKIIRHGYESYDPTKGYSPTNRHLLAEELGHVELAKTLLVKSGELTQNDIDNALVVKAEKVNKYLHFNEVK